MLANNQIQKSMTEFYSSKIFLDLLAAVSSILNWHAPKAIERCPRPGPQRKFRSSEVMAKSAAADSDPDPGAKPIKKKATPRFELGIKDLQSFALPLGYIADIQK